MRAGCEMKLHLKLAIFVIVLFALVITGMLLWKPIKVRYYAPKYAKCSDPKERIRIARILCDCGEAGKQALYDVFREFCMSEQVRIPAGSFMMGSEKGVDSEKPVHEVTLSGFMMDTYEVTNEKYYVFVRLTGHRAPPFWKVGEEQHPVIIESWEDAKAYTDW